MRAYDDGKYAAAERELHAALARGPAQRRRDRAAAHKLLAFVYCTQPARRSQCEHAFRAARAADPRSR